MNTLLLLIGLGVGVQGVQVQGVLGRRVEVGRCRASCLPLTPTCWEECEEVREGRSSNRPGRGRVGGRRRRRLVFPSAPLLTPTSLSWPPPLPSPNSFSPSSPPSLVYLVAGRDAAGAWYELGQTPLPTLTLQPATMQKMVTLRLLAIGETGVEAQASLEVRKEEEEEEEEEEEVEQEVGRSVQPVVRRMEEVGLLVRVEVVWSAVAAATYMVRWQEVGGLAVTATLVTTDPTASISLQKGTIYTLEVEVLGEHRTTSLPILISTVMVETNYTHLLAFFTLLALLLLLLTITGLVKLGLGQGEATKGEGKEELSTRPTTLTRAAMAVVKGLLRGLLRRGVEGEGGQSSQA